MPNFRLYFSFLLFSRIKKSGGQDFSGNFLFQFPLFNFQTDDAVAYGTFHVFILFSWNTSTEISKLFELSAKTDFLWFKWSKLYFISTRNLPATIVSF